MQILVLGPLEVRTPDGCVLEVPGTRLRTALTALALRPGHLVSKAALVDWIWGEQPPADAANALQRLVSRLRKALPGAVLEGLTDGYRLQVEPDAVDAVRFERLLGAGQAAAGDPARCADLLREAIGLWRGSALEDVGLPGNEALDAAANRLEGLRLNAAEECFDVELTLGRGAELVAELGALSEAYPLRERLAAALMRALVAAGRDNEALQVFQRTREALAEELGADPSAELSALHVAVLRRGAGERAPRRATNLRAELTSFVGRDEEVAAVRELAAGHRLSTLIGPGGAGKTRLAVETARTMVGGLPDGVWLVELAALGADGDVARAVLAAVGLRDAVLGEASEAEPADRVAAAIGEQEMLLVLDNCEHVIESAAAFADRVLGGCRGLRILATSREPLGITGESLWPVVPLVLPARDAEPAAIESAAAVRLLRDRAGAVRADLGTDAETSRSLARVCRALDGMPLAIELAAARLRTMTLHQLAHRLDDRFRLLTGGSRTALPRHRTLRAVIDWSWELLTDAERLVLRRLAVFSGGASLAAAERICAGEEADAVEVFDVLTALTEKSLVLAEGERTPRYRMLGTIKEYAAQRLAEAGEWDAARRTHLDCFTEFVEIAEPHLYRAEQLDWLATLEAEHDNIAAAMSGALAAGEARGAMRLAAAAGWYWWLGGHKAEGNELIKAAAALPGEVADESRAVVYARALHAGVHAGRSVRDLATWGPRDRRQSEEWIRRAFEISRRVPGSHRALRFIAALERMLHAPEEAGPALELLLADEDPWLRALARLHLGRLRIVLGRDSREADADLGTALAEFRALGDRWGISFASTELANRIATRGEFAEACAYYEQAVAAITDFGGNEDVVPLRSRQAQLYWLAGESDSSEASLAAAQRAAEQVAWPNALAELALARAELAHWRGDAEQAHSQLGIVTAMLGSSAERAYVRAVATDLRGYLALDLAEAHRHRAAAVRAAAEAEHRPLIAQVLVGVADLALRQGDPAQAARLLAASDAVRGLPDLSHPDAVRIGRETRERLGESGLAEAHAQGVRDTWSQLAAATLGS